MKPRFLSRSGLLAGFAVMLLSTTLYAEGDALEPTWVRAGTDWTQYTSFLVKPLNIDDVKVLKPAWSADDPEEWTLQTVDKAAVQDMFAKSVSDALQANGGYAVVSAPAANAVEVEVQLLSVKPWLKPGSEGMVDGKQMTTLGSGQVRGSVALRDSTTRELLLLIEGVKAAGEEYKVFTAENNLANLQVMFGQFGNRLREAMDKVHQK